MRLTLTVVVDLADDAELGDIRDMRSHVAIALEGRREVRAVESVRATAELTTEAA